MKNIGTFFNEVKVELSKVIWPTKEEFIGSTLVGLFIILVFTIFFGVINQLFYTGAAEVFQVLVSKFQ